MTTETQPINIMRMKSVLRDIIWIGINSVHYENLAHSVKYLINMAIEDNITNTALRLCTETMGSIKVPPDLSLYWQHVYKEELGGIFVEFAIGGPGISEPGYEQFVNAAKKYFDNLHKTNSRMF